MSKCTFYEIETKTLESREITNQPRRASNIEMPWCSHHLSPVSLEIATGVVGGGRLLKCGGDIEKCQVDGGFPQD